MMSHYDSQGLPQRRKRTALYRLHVVGDQQACRSVIGELITNNHLCFGGFTINQKRAVEVEWTTYSKPLAPVLDKNTYS